MQKLKTALQFNILYKILIIISLLLAITTTIRPLKSKYQINETQFLCIVNDYEIDGNKLTLDLKCKENLKGIYYLNTKKEKEIFEALEFGDEILLNGNLSLPKNNTIPNLFNYKKYLNKQGINYILNIDQIKFKNKTKNIFYKLKNLVYLRAKNIKYNEYIYTYILGKNNKIDAETLKNYRTNGISHLFALSGLHVSIFSITLLSIFKKFKLNTKISYIIISCFLFLFSFISGFSPSILRATIFFTLLNINKIYKLEIKTINLLYLTFIILITYNPYLIYNLSFLLSFTTTYFIITKSNDLNNKNYIITLIKVSSISFISTLGLSVYFFGYINPLGVVLNLIFVPLVSYIIFPLAIIAYLIPSLSYFLHISVIFMETLSNFLINFKLTIYFVNINLIEVTIYYLLLILSIKTKKKLAYCILICTIMFWYLKPKFIPNTEIYFIDVGQGDSTLIITPRRKTSVLIDTGGKLNYETEEWKKKREPYSLAIDSLIPFMRSLGINKVNYLILTHGDYDHMGEAINLVKNFKAEKVIFNCGKFNDLEQELIKVLDKNKIPYYSCIKELNIENNKLYFLNNKDYGNENDNSSVIYSELNNYKFLFMGDASVEVEGDLIDKYNLQDIDVLKVGHHGSKTSSSKTFIDEINPKYSIISVGQNNRYGHPNDSVLDNLKYSQIYRTDKDGSIIFKIKKNKLELKTCSP